MPVEPQGARRPHRLRASLVAALLLALAGGGSYAAAVRGVDWLETRSEAQVRQALAATDTDWAKVSADGLTLRLTGTAPDEIARVRALAVASEHVALARIEDDVVVPPPPAAVPPTFRMEILRSGEGTSVIGLVPAALDQAELMGRLSGLQNGQRPTDLIEEADYPPPDGWDQAVALALDAAELAPRAKITATPGRVEVTAVTDGDAEQARLEQSLREATPDGVELTTSISAPRPVIAPFVLTLQRSASGAALPVCAVGTPQGRERIIAAARAAGAANPDCTVALGEPSPQWVDAAVAAIEAAGQLDEAKLTLTDVSIELDAPASVDPADFETARDQLSAALPAAFSLTATQEKAGQPGDPGPVSFDASATHSGVHLRGTVSDDRMRAALESFAGSRFGQVDSTLHVNDGAPQGWTVRVLGALRVMADLERGTATVTPEKVRIGGSTGDRNAADALTSSLAKLLGPGVPYELALTYDPRLDPASDLPTGEQCIARANEALGKATIGFETNRADIVGDPADTMAQLTTALKKCHEFRIELGGHTDTQGSDGFNMELSQKRAGTVLAAMTVAGIDTTRMVAKGYGETRPIADNATEDGRATNRRLEFRLLSPYPVAESIEPAKIVTGVTAKPLPEQATTTATVTADVAQPAAADEPAADMPMMDRLPGVPPALAGLESATPAPDAEMIPAAASAPAPEADNGEAEATPTPDDEAAAEGISLRPTEITVQGNRVSTPVPPPLIQPPPDAADTQSRRPAPRPDQPAGASDETADESPADE